MGEIKHSYGQGCRFVLKEGVAGPLTLNQFAPNLDWVRPILFVAKDMNFQGISIRDSAALDFVSLGGLVHGLDPGVIPFRKAHECKIHVSGGEFNVAANLSDCFGLPRGIVTAMVIDTKGVVPVSM